MQFFSGIPSNTQSKSYMLSLTECDWDFQNNDLWDTHEHALLDDFASLNFSSIYSTCTLQAH